MFIKAILTPVLDNIRDHGSRQAFCINGRFYSYMELGEHISKIRKAIQQQRPVTGRIGLVTNDDIETYASIYAVWLEGLAYVPLHHQQPKERSLEVISQAEVDLVLNSITSADYFHQRTLFTSGLSFDNLYLEPHPVQDTDLAYILFTSGSTGKPKGVPLMRKNLAAFMNSFMQAGFSVTAEDRCLQCFDLTFDVSVQSFIVPLSYGACAYTIPHDQIKYSYVYGLMEDHQLTFAVMAPSMIRYLRPYFGEIDVPSMRYCILTAEASPLDMVNEWAACIPNATIFDFYGPTEATIYCTYYTYKRGGPNKELNGMLSIGKPMAGVDAVITDESRKLLGLNEKGELCIAGDQLTPGYWNNPEKNAESFFEMDYHGEKRRFYKTGDLCYMDDEGDIMYSGRLDFQVKIQGYRIELGEIEHHARESNGKRNAIALPSQNASGNTEIVLFLEGADTDIAAVTDHLRSRLPAYMMPAKYLVQELFPLNTNGKIDRVALKKMIS